MLNYQGFDAGQKTIGPGLLDCGLECLRILAAYHQVELSQKDELFQIGVLNRRAEFADLIRIAVRHGLKARLIQVTEKDRLASLPLPAVARLKSGEFVLLSRIANQFLFRVVSPMVRSERVLSPDDLLGEIEEDVLLLTRRFQAFRFYPGQFGLSWFAQSIWRYRKSITHILVASFFIQVLALVTPLFFQVAIEPKHSFARGGRCRHSHNWLYLLPRRVECCTIHAHTEVGM